jgi:hypothetical protein
LSGCLFEKVEIVDSFGDGGSNQGGKQGTAGDLAMGDGGDSAGTGGANNVGASSATSGNGGKSNQGGTPSTGGGDIVQTGGQNEGGDGGGVVVPKWKNYQITGSWPNQPVAIATKAGGTLKYTRVAINTHFWAESCAIGDYNNDGTPDISSGRRWYEGPAFTKVNVFRNGHDDLPRNGDSSELQTGVADDSADYAFDMNDDGWADIINVSAPDTDDSKNPSPQTAPQPNSTAYWYENPGAGAAVDAQWTPHLMHDDVRGEQHGIVDVDGDGKPELFGACKSCNPAQTKGYYAADWKNPSAKWKYYPVTRHYNFPFGGLGYLHGMGFNDVDGDGKPDLLERNGAWIKARDAKPEQTPDETLCPSANCAFIGANFYDGLAGDNRGPSHIYAFDIDGDGDQDVISADWAHGWGLAWYEQTAPQIFTRHQFMGTNSAADLDKYGPVAFSEPHAMQVADMDGDGIPEMITGKQRFANPLSQNDPDPQGIPVSYVFKVKRNQPSNGSPVTFELHELDTSADIQKAGVGRQIAIGHIDKDGIPDVCVASRLGLFVYYGGAK